MDFLSYILGRTSACGDAAESTGCVVFDSEKRESYEQTEAAYKLSAVTPSIEELNAIVYVFGPPGGNLMASWLTVEADGSRAALILADDDTPFALVAYEEIEGYSPGFWLLRTQIMEDLINLGILMYIAWRQS